MGPHLAHERECIEVPLQELPTGHCMPQPPQLPGSLLALSWTQAPPQHVPKPPSGRGQPVPASAVAQFTGSWQMPNQQYEPPTHCTPQAPQLSSS